MYVIIFLKEKFYGKKLIMADREMVEQKSGVHIYTLVYKYTHTYTNLNTHTYKKIQYTQKIIKKYIFMHSHIHKQIYTQKYIHTTKTHTHINLHFPLT